MAATEALLPYQPRVVVQTRGPLVVRDIDVLTRFDALRVNFSIPTDSEAVRMRFEPKTPPLDRRWQAVEELSAAGVPVGICVTPTLPIEDSERFADRIAAVNAAVVVTQDFHDAGGRFGADTGEAAAAIVSEFQLERGATREPMTWPGDLRERALAFEVRLSEHATPRTLDSEPPKSNVRFEDVLARSPDDDERPSRLN